MSRHAWNLSTGDAIRLQRELAHQVQRAELPGAPAKLAGVDVSTKKGWGHAAIVVLSLPELDILEQVTWHAPLTFPYVPGLLSFREMPLLIPAWEALSVRPDVLMVDGHGYAHPRRFGLACHLGLWLDIPSFGVAKRPFVGEYEEPAPEKGSRSALCDPATGEVLGAVLRTRARVRPVYVSTGHRITLEEAVRLALATASRYRIPEPTRAAHLASRKWPERVASERSP